MNNNTNSIDNLLPPLQYDVIWMLIGIGLVLIAVIFIYLVLLFTKKLKPEDFIKPLAKEVTGAERLSLVKNKYAEEIQSVQTRWDSKEISTRKAFQLLSISLRNFTHEYSGSQAFSMDLQDLENAQAPEILTDKIRNYYPLAFEEANRTGNVRLATEDALRLVQVWN